MFVLVIALLAAAREMIDNGPSPTQDLPLIERRTKTTSRFRTPPFKARLFSEQICREVAKKVHDGINSKQPPWDVGRQNPLRAPDFESANLTLLITAFTPKV